MLIHGWHSGDLIKKGVGAVENESASFLPNQQLRRMTAKIARWVTMTRFGRLHRATVIRYARLASPDITINASDAGHRYGASAGK